MRYPRFVCSQVFHNIGPWIIHLPAANRMAVGQYDGKAEAEYWCKKINDSLSDVDESNESVRYKTERDEPLIDAVIKGAENWLVANKRQVIPRDIAYDIVNNLRPYLNLNIENNPDHYEDIIAEAIVGQAECQNCMDDRYPAAARVYEEIIKPLLDENKRLRSILEDIEVHAIDMGDYYHIPVCEMDQSLELVFPRKILKHKGSDNES